jgi:hypothetical protein
MVRGVSSAVVTSSAAATGGSFSPPTAIDTVATAVAWPSLTVNSYDAAPLKSWVGANVTSLPVIATVPFTALPTAVRVSASCSTSDAAASSVVTAVTSGVSSLAASDRLRTSGGSLTAPTVIEIVPSAVCAPSVTCTEIVSVPLKLAAGV